MACTGDGCGSRRFFLRFRELECALFFVTEAGTSGEDHPRRLVPKCGAQAGCADWSRGVAKIVCQDCQHVYFRPFSCKVFHLCPSCDQKRTLLYAEYLAQELLPLLPHRQFVFTIPKILRPILQNNKRLFGAVSGLIFKHKPLSMTYSPSFRWAALFCWHST